MTDPWAWRSDMNAPAPGDLRGAPPEVRPTPRYSFRPDNTPAQNAIAIGYDPFDLITKGGMTAAQAFGPDPNTFNSIERFLSSPGGNAVMTLANFIGPRAKPGIRPPVPAAPEPTGIRPPVPAAPEPTGIRAYHGSPHKFDKFSLDKIGTGEGAQAYGHGLYFAENEGVARGYRDSVRDKLSHRQPGEYLAEQMLLLHKGDYKKAIAEAKSAAKESRNPSSEYHAAAGLLRDGWKPADPGHLYEVNIKAHPDQFLDWDKPLSQQSEAVRKALDKIGAERGRMTDQEVRVFNSEHEARRAGGHSAIVEQTVDGNGFIARNGNGYVVVDGTGNFIQNKGMHVAAGNETALREAGIAGIVYDDAGSRGAADGPKTRNRVVFDDSIVEILRRYGLAGLMAGLGGAAANQAEAKP